MDNQDKIELALITLGEGWHKNHHYAPSSERQEFSWWEIDFTHYVLAALSWLGIVWDLQSPPPGAFRSKPRDGKAVATATICSE